MVWYSVGCMATSNSTINTQDLFLEIKAATNAIIKIKRVRVQLGSGKETTGQDGNFLLQLYRYTTTTAGSSTALTYPSSSSAAGGASGNMWTARSALAQNAGSTAKVKTGTTACVIGTGSVQVLDQVVIPGRAVFEWIARDDEDMYISPTAGCFAIAIACSVASQIFTMTVDYQE